MKKIAAIVALALIPVGCAIPLVDGVTEKVALAYTTAKCDIPPIAKLLARIEIMEHSPRGLVMVSKCVGDRGYDEFKRKNVDKPRETLEALESPEAEVSGDYDPDVKFYAERKNKLVDEIYDTIHGSTLSKN